MPDRKKILLVAPYVTFPGEPGANRFITIANMLSNEYEVTLVTSSFCHILKTQRPEVPNTKYFKTVLLNEPGYKKNVSFMRFLSHKIFCNNFERFLKESNTSFDLIYSAYPLIYTNFLLGKNKKFFNYRLIIDVQDIWPDSITGAIKSLSSSLGKIILYPINKYADKTYSYADGLIAVSESYLNKADVSELPFEKKKVVYIGTDKVLDKNPYNPQLDLKRPLTATYIGTIGGSYDLDTIVKAAPLCKDKVNIQFIGTGPHEYKLKKLNESLGSHVTFLGTMPYEQAMQVLSNSDLAINPIKASAQQSVTNKLSDYFACGLPILSCQSNPEVKAILSTGGNLQYKASNVEDLVRNLLYINKNRSKLPLISSYNFSLAKRKFSRQNSYLEILDLIDTVLKS